MRKKMLAKSYAGTVSVQKYNFHILSKVLFPDRCFEASGFPRIDLIYCTLLDSISKCQDPHPYYCAYPESVRPNAHWTLLQLLFLASGIFFFSH